MGLLSFKIEIKSDAKFESYLSITVPNALILSIRRIRYMRMVLVHLWMLLGSVVLLWMRRLILMRMLDRRLRWRRWWKRRLRLVES